MSQESLLPGRDPEELIAEAKERWQPLRTFCMFSGGNDSIALAHRCRDHYDELFFINTGIVCLPGVEEHVHRVAKMLGKPVVILNSGEAFREIVLGDDRWWDRYWNVTQRRWRRRGRPGLTPDLAVRLDRLAGRREGDQYGRFPCGFPGKGQHGRAYSRLKERRIEDLLRQVKEGQPRSASVLFLSGVRSAESARRKNREPLTERYSMKFCNPLIDWSTPAVADYRNEHDLPRSEVADLLHRSGECNCGAFADAEEERKLIETFWPEWWEENIASLEREAQRHGLRWCVWGGYDIDGNQAAEESEEKPGLICSSCSTRNQMELALETAA